MVNCCVNCEQGTNRLPSQTTWNVKEKRVVKNDHRVRPEKEALPVMEGEERGWVWRGA